MIYNVLLIHTFLQGVTWEIEETGETFILKLSVTGWVLGAFLRLLPLETDQMRPGGNGDRVGSRGTVAEPATLHQV